MTAPTRAALAELDRDDPLASKRQLFRLPPGLLYFDGNSLGPLTHASRERLRRTCDREWGEDLIGAWNRHRWIDLPRRLGARIARLIGAAPSQVLVADSTSVNLFKLLAAALALRPDRRVVLSERANFPTDLYVAEGLAELRRPRPELRLVDRDALVDAIDGETAVVSLTQVDFKTGELHDMAALTRAAHRRGALILWDLSHSAGALPIALDESGVDFAVGCTYKFLNGGPGAPAYLYVALRHLPDVRSPLRGWFGHRDPFAFETGYQPAPGIDRFACGTPPILSLVAADAALEVFDGVDLDALRRKSMALGDFFLTLVETRCKGFGLAVACPRDARRRGSQVSLRHPHGYAIIQALIERGVIGDFRTPDVLRFGICPLYQRYVDVWDAVAALRRVLATRALDAPRFARRAAVT